MNESSKDKKDMDELFDYMVTSALRMPEQERKSFIRTHLEVYANSSDEEREKLFRWMLKAHKKQPQETRETLERLFQEALRELPKEQQSKINDAIQKIS